MLPNVSLRKVCVKRGLSSLLTKLGFTVLVSVSNKLYHRHFTSVTLHDAWFDNVFFFVYLLILESVYFFFKYAF